MLLVTVVTVGEENLCENSENWEMQMYIEFVL